MRKILPFLFPLFIVWLGTSCVPKRKLTAANDKIVKMRVDSIAAHGQLDECNVKVKNLLTEKASLMGDKASALNALENVTEQSQLTIAQQQERLANLQRLIGAQRDAMNRLQKTVSDALNTYKAEDLSVYVKDGQVYVSLQERLLFKSGSAVVDSKGKEALASLARVLNATPDITIIIEGHTDNVPIKTAQFPDNWALSVARATAIVRVLTKDYNVDPHKIQASGKSEFYPVANNGTPEGKASNRRTEIILSPKLDELYQLLGSR